MCLAMPAQVTELKPGQLARVNLGGIEKEISTVLLSDVSVGDYVIIHVGYALTKLDQAEAKKTLAAFAELHALGEPATEGIIE
jgi:hydrogenase expression/formation protein HypC